MMKCTVVVSLNVGRSMRVLVGSGRCGGGKAGRGTSARRCRTRRAPTVAHLLLRGGVSGCLIFAGGIIPSGVGVKYLCLMRKIRGLALNLHG